MAEGQGALEVDPRLMKIWVWRVGGVVLGDVRIRDVGCRVYRR